MNRISEINAWTTCELRAASSIASPRPESAPHVAGWVGTLAHRMTERALIAHRPDDDDAAAPEAPPRLRYDATTRTLDQARRQAAAVSAAVVDALRRLDAVALRAEQEVALGGLTGHYDLIIALHVDPAHRARLHQPREVALCDIKTGRDVGAAWLQIGGYIEAVRAAPGGDQLGVSLGAVIAAPRTDPENVTIEARPADELAAAWRAAYARARAVIYEGARPIARPGAHCAHCTVRRCPASTTVRNDLAAP